MNLFYKIGTSNLFVVNDEIKDVHTCLIMLSIDGNLVLIDLISSQYFLSYLSAE